jgi:hypothetical protein
MSEGGKPAYLFTGDRDWTDSYIVSLLLRGLHHIDREQGTGIMVVHGAATGLDTCVDREGDYLGMDVRGYPADWAAHGKSAGPRRNRQMMQATDPRVVFAFHDDITQSKGTKDMIRVALAAERPTYLIKHAKGTDL